VRYKTSYAKDNTIPHWFKDDKIEASFQLAARKGFSSSNLWYMKKWYQFYEPVLKSKKLQQLVGEIAVETNTRLRQQIALAEEEYKHKLRFVTSFEKL
jgi:hypothetical protein